MERGECDMERGECDMERGECDMERGECDMVKRVKVTHLTANSYTLAICCLHFSSLVDLKRTCTCGR